MLKVFSKFLRLFGVNIFYSKCAECHAFCSVELRKIVESYDTFDERKKKSLIISFYERKEVNE